MATFEMASSMAMAYTLGRQVCRCVCIDRHKCARTETDSCLPKRAPPLPPSCRHMKGDRYAGEYVEDFKHGRGVYTWANGRFCLAEYSEVLISVV